MKKTAKSALSAASIAAIAPLVGGCGQQKTQDIKVSAQHPNIVFFLVDDMGWVDSGVQYGTELYPYNQRYDTPNMQRLSERAVVFGNAYAQAVSTPTRISIMTGMNAAHAGITNWTSPYKDTYSDATGGGFSMVDSKVREGYIEGDYLSHPEWNINGISPEPGIPHTQFATPMVRLLRDAGYYTIHVGKAHWAAAGTPGVNPYNQGFCVNIAGTMAGMPRNYQGKDNYGNTPQLWNEFAVQNLCEYYGTDVHLTEALKCEALKTLEYPIRHNVPFYLYMSNYATHTPIQPDERFVQKYRDRGMDEGQARYASMVEGVDKALGDIMDFLDEKGIADNTVIIFMTDNGGNSENKQKGGIPHTQNLPLREGKGSCYEGGVRVPLMIFWPGKTRSGRCDVPVICEDLFPTILDIAGVDSYETVQEIDGQSIIPMITGGESLDPERPLIMHFPHKWKAYDLDDIDFLSAVRMGDWKLVYRIKTGELELYNLVDDIGEQNNVAAQNPEITKRLADTLSDRLRKWKSPMPVVAATGQTMPLPDSL